MPMVAQLLGLVVCLVAGASWSGLFLLSSRRHQINPRLPAREFSLSPDQLTPRPTKAIWEEAEEWLAAQSR